MKIRKAAMVLPLAALAAMMLMGNTKCSSGLGAGGVSSGPRIYTGLGDAPAVSLPGQWVRVKGNVHGLPRWVWWPVGGGTLGAVGGKALGSWALANSGGAHSTKGTLGSSGPYALTNNPCRDRKPSFRLSEFTTKLSKSLNTSLGGRNPFLDCASLDKITRNHGVPARWKYLLDCITLIINKGSASRATGNLAWTLNGGSVTVDGANRIIDAAPPTGMTWGQCSRMG